MRSGSDRSKSFGERRRRLAEAWVGRASDVAAQGGAVGGGRAGSAERDGIHHHAESRLCPAHQWCTKRYRYWLDALVLVLTGVVGSTRPSLRRATETI